MEYFARNHAQAPDFWRSLELAQDSIIKNYFTYTIINKIKLFYLYNYK